MKTDKNPGYNIKKYFNLSNVETLLVLHKSDFFAVFELLDLLSFSANKCKCIK